MPQRPQPAQARTLTQADLVAVFLAGLWITVSGLAVWILLPDDLVPVSLRLIIMLQVMVVPVAIGGGAVVMLRALRGLQAENRQLRAEIVALRAAQGTPAPQPVVRPAAKPLASPPAAFASRRDPVRAVTRPVPDQASLALGESGEAVPLARADLIHALNFPDTEADEAGFVALRRALRDAQARHLVQSSQDVLTLLSQDGLYMDDLRPDPAGADLWRRFTSGARGSGIAGFGTWPDPAPLATIAARLRADTIFRDSVHHFLRRFDKFLLGFEKEASDAEILALAETRTARAFVLLGRASGIFD